MGLSALRLRRSLNLSSCLFLYHRLLSAVPSSSSAAVPRSIPSSLIANSARGTCFQLPNHVANQALSFHSSSVLSLSARSPNCWDYNPWLIIMDLPKDPKPTSEEMIETYVQTAAKALGSVEEANRRMYTCSTTYHGFQAVITEEESKKFEGLPGVVLISPVTWYAYGGDTCMDGVTIAQTAPLQYGRSPKQYGDQNGNCDRPRRDPLPPQGDGRNYGAQQNHPPQQDYSPQQNYPSQQHYPPQQNYTPQQNYPLQQNYGTQQNYPPQQSYAPQQSYGPPGQGKRSGLMRVDRGDIRNCSPSHGLDYGQGARTGYQQGAGIGYGQGEQRNAIQGEQRNCGAQGQFRTKRVSSCSRRKRLTEWWIVSRRLLVVMDVMTVPLALNRNDRRISVYWDLRSHFVEDHDFLGCV